MCMLCFRARLTLGTVTRLKLHDVLLLRALSTGRELVVIRGHDEGWLMLVRYC